ncbi:sensor histidine kinase [Marinimicrobium sp. ABcell2]|uniref:sensor histidine kinase n=1 Tax=Marinimicrobium sp. ABcell2 TaxID=3069751 RepID=UPI0027B32D37|nr:sensor histidine kinase [Marinimicrobium sp. ABcell2]MDQ2075183.1 sensor histidine kinase [Marinimicrobium sp. ABcell2]
MSEASRTTIKPWFWLIFSLYYFMPLFFIDYSPIQIGLFVISYAGFVICYLLVCRRWCSWRDMQPTPWPIAGIVIIAIAASTFTPSVDTMFSYSALLLALCYPPRVLVPLLAGLVVLCVTLGLYHNYTFPFLTLTGSFAVVAMSLIGIAERTRLQMHLQEERSQEELQQMAKIAERERIARDLHDILGHSLSSIALKAELAEKLLTQNKIDEGKGHLSELNQIARESLHLVRETVSGYKHRGLSGEVMALCERLRENNFAVTLEGEMPALNSKAETTLILALTELTTNILRHSRGSHCQLAFAREEEQLRISIRDNGTNARIKMGNGLRGICERLAVFNGDLHIDTGAQSSFTIAIPLTRVQPQ